MDKIKLFRTLAQESSLESGRFNSSSSGFSSDQASIIVRRAPGRVVSLWTCSKLCAVTFVVGVVVGFTLKRCVKRWASKLLKRLKDD